MRRGLALLLTATLALSMTACGGSKGAGTQKIEKGDGMTYAVEAGSAGEAVAKEKGFNYNSVSSQADALMEVKSGTSDASIIDLLMAGAMIGEGTSYPDLVHTTEPVSYTHLDVYKRQMIMFFEALIKMCCIRKMQFLHNFGYRSGSLQ